MNGHGTEKKHVNSEKVKIIQNVEENQTVLQNEVVKCFVLPTSSMSNIILWNVSVLEQESWCEHTKRNEKPILLIEQGSMPYYWFN